MRCSGAAVWEQYGYARERLQAQLAHKLRSQMAALVGNMDSADLLLVAADGKKLAAHECILRARAPGFYQRHVEATVAAMGPPQHGRLREVAIGDIDSSGLEFFIHSVYTEDEIAQFPPDSSADDRYSDSRASNRSFRMDESTDLEDFKAQDREEHVLPKGDTPDQTPTGVIPSQQYPSHVPMMTSFRDLASHSPMNSSIYSLGGRSEIGPDIPEEDEDGSSAPIKRRNSRHEELSTSMSKFIRLDSVEADREKIECERKRSSGHKAIFPMFIGLDESAASPSPVPDGVRGRAMMAKRLSVASLTSLTSIDITPSHDGNAPLPDRTPSSKLSSDLLQMYLNNRDTDVVLKCENGELFAHRCILSATCPFFRQQLVRSRRIELKGYSKTSVHFLLSFLYGGLTSIPDDVDVWEVVALATHLNLKDLVDVVVLHLKAARCHWFHRPCAACVSAVFDCLPQIYSIRCLKPLYEEAIQWQAKYFSRIWKGRVFLHLNERWHKECFEGVIQQLDDETVIETILGCERLQVAFSRAKTDAAFHVLNLVNEVLDVSMQYLIHSFHLVVTSKSFAAQGKGLALNLGIMEDILPTLVHSLSADVAIKSYLGLGALLMEIQSVPPSPKRTLSIPIDEWSPRFYILVRRLCELVDKHLLHYAASVVRADAWDLLDEQDQLRIRETGLFVEMRQPKAAPPRFTSNTRAYKRSSSAGVQMTTGIGTERGRSLDRPRPLSTIQQKASTSEKSSIIEKDDEDIKPSTSAHEITTNKAEKVEKGSQKDATPRREEARRPKTPVETIAKERATSRSSSRETTPRTPRNTQKTSTEKTKETSPREPKNPKLSPVKKRLIENEEGRMERQHTHTIMSADPAKAAELPGPSPKHSSTEKPKSVVKPMPKDPPLATTAGRNITRAPVRVSTREQPPKTTATATRSGIPQSVSKKTTKPSSIHQSKTTAATGTNVTQTETRKRSDQQGTRTSSPRSPKSRLKKSNNIEKG